MIVLEHTAHCSLTPFIQNKLSWTVSLTLYSVTAEMACFIISILSLHLGELKQDLT